MLQKLLTLFSRLEAVDFSHYTFRREGQEVSNSELFVIASACRGLLSLSLQGCKAITDDGLIAIGSNLSLLQSLNVTGCGKLTNKSLSHVAERCRDLRILRLGHCRFTDSFLKVLSKNCHNLEQLYMRGCCKFTDVGLSVFTEGCQKLKFLDLSKCSKVGYSGILSISKSFLDSLKCLDLTYCIHVGDSSLLSVARHCKSLESLAIGGCLGVSDEALKSMATYCSKTLKSLEIGRHIHLSDSSLECILTRCTNLLELELKYCFEITDAAFECLGSGEVKLNLKCFSISYCQRVTASGIKDLLKACPSFSYLEVKSCLQITKDSCYDANVPFPSNCITNFFGT